MKTPAAISTLVLSFSGALAAQVGQGSLINPNLAGEEELAALSQISSALAKRIIDGRPYLDMLSLHALLSSSLTEQQLDAVYSRLFVPLNLNQTTGDEILLIPRVGERMKGEFEEYQPYRTLPQFRREIGKYVDADELARLEQYVFVPLDLNTASEEDILTIPGVGNRMLHEFLEYRPYRNIAQFRREIGKYVDDDEVARLERYVTVR